MTRLILAPEAAQDIDEILLYIVQNNEGAALALEDQLNGAFRHLSEFPHSGHARRDLAGNRKMLFWPVGRYLILYRPVTNEIEILAVLHAARNIPKLLSRRKA